VGDGGLGLNLRSGRHGFYWSGQYYTYDWAFWLKNVAIIASRTERGGFLLDRRFDSVEGLGPGTTRHPRQIYRGDPLSFPVVYSPTLGRYIQSFADTISVPQMR